jgi:hypothetical protein
MDEPTTILESLQKMGGRTIRKLILEAETYMADQAYESVVATLKSAIGLGLPARLQKTTPNDPCVMLDISIDEPQWRSISKLIAATGGFMDKAAVPILFKIGKSIGETTRVRIVASTFHPRFEILLNMEEDEITARDFLGILEGEGE